MTYTTTPELLLALQRGLLRLLSLRLAYAPEPGLLAMTEQTWIDAMHDKGLNDGDAQRVALGFRMLARDSHYWPAPSDLFDIMPPRPREYFHVLKAPQLTPEQEAADEARRHQTILRVRALVQPWLDRMTGRSRE